MNELIMLKDSLKDISGSEIRVLQAVALAQRQKESNRTGLVKWWSALYCLLKDEQERRKKEIEKIELEMMDMQEPVTEWTGKPDPDPKNKANLKIYYQDPVEPGEPEND